MHSKSLSRRLAILVGCAWPFAACVSAAPDSVASLIRRADRANQAFIRGEMREWLGLAGPIASDFTLMQPFGGPASHGFDASDAHLDELARRFRNGEATFQLVQSYATADMVALVFVERQHGEVSGLADQDWSLRVTQIYQRRNDAWELVHRHADPLTRNIGLEHAAALARGA